MCPKENKLRKKNKNENCDIEKKEKLAKKPIQTTTTVKNYSQREN